jgi:hypothetical protein
LATSVLLTVPLPSAAQSVAQILPPILEVPVIPPLEENELPNFGVSIVSFEALLAKPVAAGSALVQLLTPAIVWSCRDRTCTARAASGLLTNETCRALSRQFGTAVSLRAGARAMGNAQLDHCNASN